MSLKDHHVHFGVETDSFPKDNDIAIQPVAQGVLAVHLGFLQVGHRYSINFEIPRVLCSPWLLENWSTPSCSDTSLTNPNCHVIQIGLSENGLQLTVEFFAYKEKLMKEELCLLGSECSQDGAGFKLIFNARVLGEQMFYRSDGLSNLLTSHHLQAPLQHLFFLLVTGQRKGTPLLRNGIRCIAVELEDESEASDWQSFD